ncbi:MAG: acetyl-CoA carboxylase, carboxyltransferase subunit beta [bacterium]
MRRGHQVENNKPVPGEGDWIHCGKCKRILFAREFERNMHVCPHCSHHHRLSARQRIEITLDPGTFKELDNDLQPFDLLDFPEYKEKIEKGKTVSGLDEALITGKGKIGGLDVLIGVFDFGFIGGSMGSVVGEKVTRLMERGTVNNTPVVIFCASGGARMHEGLTALMQMAKTTAAVEKLQRAGSLYIAVFTDPTMAGVLASFASLADVILSEPGAQVGFAGERVAKQAQVNKVPDNFRTAEFQYQRGQIDRIVPRREIRTTLMTLLDILAGG